MKTKSRRRNFLKRGVMLGTGLTMLRSGSVTARAAENKNAADAVPLNDTIKTINGLRTTHGNFTDENIPDSKIQLILQSCIRAANASNMQTYSVIVVKDRDKMKSVCQYSGSHMLLFCVDYTRLKACAESLGHPYYPDSSINFITGSTNTILAAQTAVIAAKSLGIDSLLTNGIHRGDMNRVWELMDLPKESCYPLIALVLGYPTEEPEHKKGRLDGAGIFHYEKYHRLTKNEIDGIVGSVDDKQSHIGLNDTWDENGFKHYYDWFFTAWNRDRKPSEKETQHFELLKRSGFVDLQKA